MNAPVAALWSAHVHHASVHRWLEARPETDAVLSCGLTEAGFIRVINAAYGVPVADAKAVLAAFRERARLGYLADTPSPLDALPAWVRSHKQVMDGYLTGLAGAPDDIARLVERALTADNPTPRYSAPLHAKFFLFLKWLLPDRMLEFIVRLRK